jgi:hypothetical protein
VGWAKGWRIHARGAVWARLGALAIASSLAVAGCGNHREGAGKTAPSASARPGTSASAPSASGSPSAAESGEPASSGSAAASAPNPPVGSFEPARGVKTCKTASADIAQYQQRGELAIAGRKDKIAVSFLVQLAGRRQEQVAFATFEPDARQGGRARGVGLSEHTGPRAFAVGGEWTISWFDENGFAYTHPKEEPLPAPDQLHLKAVGPGEDGAVAINVVGEEGLITAAVLPSNKDQVALFRFAPSDGSNAVRAVGVTHHAKGPSRPAVAADKEGVTVAWIEDGQKIVGSHFDAAGKEVESACVIAPKGEAERKDLALVSVPGGAVAIWVEGTAVHARGVGPKGCPNGPAFDVGQGTWPRAVAIEGGVLVSWVSEKGKLVAAKLSPKGAPPEKGLEIAEAVGGVKDAPAMALAGSRAAFAWTEAMGPSVSTRRMVLRTLDVDCLP